MLTVCNYTFSVNTWIFKILEMYVYYTSFDNEPLNNTVCVHHLYYDVPTILKYNMVCHLIIMYMVMWKWLSWVEKQLHIFGKKINSQTNNVTTDYIPKGQKLKMILQITFFLRLCHFIYSGTHSNGLYHV